MTAQVIDISPKGFGTETQQAWDNALKAQQEKKELQRQLRNAKAKQARAAQR